MQPLLNNRYQIIRTLEAGGFGETFLAEDTHMPSSRRCVIKQLKLINHNPQIYRLVQERFQREAAILEELGGASDQIPTLYAYFELGGQFYLVQEWIEGETLTEKLQKQGVLGESAVREILVNLLPILDYVHTKRIVHRDIKPDNIILRHRDGKPVLIDFGAVRETMGTVMNSQGNPTSSIVIGTPGYMPSEQAAGRPVYSSDLYSLGLTAIYLLTGKLPQELETNSRTGEIIWRRHALNISLSTAAALERAIQYHPRDRHATAQEMLTALINQTVPSPPLTEVSVSTPKAPSHIGDLQKILILGGLISASVIVGLILTKSPQVTVVSESKTAQEPLSTQPFSPSQPSIQPRQEDTSPAPVTSTIPARSAVAPQIPFFQPQQPSQPISIGWLRIGAVSNTSGTSSSGEPLIPTNQPVTISPPVVPSQGSQVIVTTGVNLRSSLPQPPEYKLASKVTELKPGQRLVILKVKDFVDHNSDSPLTKVWAEVGLPN